MLLTDGASVKYPNLHAPERNHQIVVCVGNGESLASDLVVELVCVSWGVAYGVEVWKPSPLAPHGCFLSPLGAQPQWPLDTAVPPQPSGWPSPLSAVSEEGRCGMLNMRWYLERDGCDMGEPGPEGWHLESHVLTWPGPRFESRQTQLLARRRLGQRREGRGGGATVLPALTGTSPGLLAGGPVPR
ncbi:unnamed protein product [Rangifer tarandus platyrhynchus]|uniref:Uncharacterized protein n=1 Tax=Rangifer tarandus platyrhynchus TaxID=3082113 RepID=A0AC59ZVA1_RANTA